jgi:hypothetical protein
LQGRKAKDQFGRLQNPFYGTAVSKKPFFRCDLTAPRKRIHCNGKSLSEEEEMMVSERLEQILKKNEFKIPPFFAIHSLMAGLLIRRNEIKATVKADDTIGPNF